MMNVHEIHEVKTHHFSKVDGQICQSKMLPFNLMDFDGIPWKSMNFHEWPLMAMNASSGNVNHGCVPEESLFSLSLEMTRSLSLCDVLVEQTRAFATIARV